MNKSRTQVLEKIKEACEKSHRNVNEIRLVAVSKKQSVEKIKSMFDLGQRAFGENYVQEFLEKKEILKNKNIEWHLIGPLQTNKVSKIIGEVDLIHSVDNLKLAKTISAKAKAKGVIQNILLQINTSGEGSKSGFEMDKSNDFIDEVLTLKSIKVLGLMTMPPWTEDPENSRKDFVKLRKIRDDFKKRGVTELSMGTTQDFEVAIEEGATIIRIGEALFGPRE